MNTDWEILTNTFGKQLISDSESTELCYPKHSIVAWWEQSKYEVGEKLYKEFMQENGLDIPELYNSISDINSTYQSGIGYSKEHISRYVMTWKKELAKDLIPNKFRKHLYAHDDAAPIWLLFKTNLKDGHTDIKPYITMMHADIKEIIGFGPTNNGWGLLDCVDNSFHIDAEDFQSHFNVPDVGFKPTWIEVDFDGNQTGKVYYLYK